MKAGDKVYYKCVDGTYIKVKLTEAKYAQVFDGIAEMEDKTFPLKDIPKSCLVDEEVYQSQLFKQMSEMERLQ